MRYSCLLGDKYKFTANATTKSQKCIILLYSVNIRMLHSTLEMLQYSKVRSNVEHSFMHK